MMRLFIALILTAAAWAQTRVVHEGQLVTAGSGGVTAKLLVTKDGSNPAQWVTVSSGSCGHGVAQATATSGNTFYVLSTPGVPYTMVADGTITSGHYLTGGTSTVGRVADTGSTSISSTPQGSCIVGVALESKTVGQDVKVLYLGGAITRGAALPHGFEASFDGGGSALSTSGGTTVVYGRMPYACTIKGWNIQVDGGTATFTVWKVASGTANPTGGDSISTSGLSISTGTNVTSTDVSDFTSTAVSANDLIAVNLQAVSGANWAHLQIDCQ